MINFNRARATALPLLLFAVSCTGHSNRSSAFAKSEAYLSHKRIDMTIYEPTIYDRGNNWLIVYKPPSWSTAGQIEVTVNKNSEDVVFFSGQQ